MVPIYSDPQIIHYLFFFLILRILNCKWLKKSAKNNNNNNIYTLCFLGPVSSYLSSIYSYRTVTLIGGTLASLGLMLCYFADSITFLYFRQVFKLVIVHYKSTTTRFLCGFISHVLTYKIPKQE